MGGWKSVIKRFLSRGNAGYALLSFFSIIIIYITHFLNKKKLKIEKFKDSRGGVTNFAL